MYGENESGWDQGPRGRDHGAGGPHGRGRRHGPRGGGGWMDGPDWVTGFGGWGTPGTPPWAGRRPGPPGPPPWIHDLIRSFGGPDLRSGAGPERGPGRRRPRARRGDVRAAILDVLAGDEMNGYQLIQEIAERTGGAWKPSPGSVYPTVQQLEDEGLVEGREAEGRRLLRLTDEGRRYVEEHPDEMAATWAPFEARDEEFVDEDPGEQAGPWGGGDRLMPVVGQVMGAMWQVVTTGTEQQRAEAVEILADTRRRLYRLLADEEDGE